MKRSAARCVAVPMPAEVKLIESGFALAALTKSCTVLWPLAGDMIITSGDCPSEATAVRSRAVS